MEPTGLTFANDAPLLLNHDHAQPVGTVQFGAPTDKGLPFVAKIAKVDEPGVVKDRTDEAWHSVKSRLIKGVSIGFIPEASEPLSNGGTRFTKASVHELSLVAIPCNPQAVITAFKSLRVAAPPTNAVSPLPEPKSIAQMPNAAKINHANKETNTMQNMKNIFIRRLIAKAMFDGDESAGTGYAANRWGATAGITNVLKSLQGPMTTDSAGALIAETLSRDEFVQAVFSRSILGQLQGLTMVPALARVNVETAPIAAKFVGEYSPVNAYQGAFGVTLSDKRKVGLIAVLSAELIRMSNDAAENAISSQLQRALSRGLDNAFLGVQARDDVTPTGLGAVATRASSFAGGLESFTGDLTNASVLVNPLTAVGLRSPSETGITAKGGTYGGLPAIASYSVPAGKIFLVDASRVVAFLGSASLDVSTSGMFPVDDGLGNVSQMQTGMFQSGQQAIRAVQYADWSFVDGAAVEVSLPA
ncbi:HK97 family phage prohead protease [Paraburkholderia agricolaris]|uniref:HK97 family phage prohead protease n=1 Tax=Paraburkholderia agricolaris TaxID=2152888 RepID=A0ABW8ZI46_9BURK